MPDPTTTTRRLICGHCRSAFIAPRRRGTPPRFCSPEHRLAARTADQKDRRAIAQATPPPPPKTAARLEAERIIQAIRDREEARLALEAVEVTEVARAMRAEPRPRPSGVDFDAARVMDTWAARDVVPVADDPALVWLLANDPEAAADFPRAHRVGRSSA